MKQAKLPGADVMYRAILNKDSKFEGVFITAVKTTGIFCRPSCTARKPKRENVEFFRSTKEAIAFGYRPCKVCRPMSMDGETPDWLNGLLKDVADNPGIRIKDFQLRERGLDPARVRRWFNKNHGMTFQSYLRSLRINRAFGQIRHNTKVVDSAFDNGYESLSGFTEAFKKATGVSPIAGREKTLVSVTRLPTPLGPMFAAAVDEGICLLEFTDRPMLETQIKRLKKLLNAEFVPGKSKHFTALNRQLQEYFKGKRCDFDLPLVLPGTEFQKRVWTILRKIPPGKTRSYSEQAARLGSPESVRAVARANGDNRISIIVPCHRVIGKDGQLVGYGGGLWRKQFLLELEKNGAAG